MVKYNCKKISIEDLYKSADSEIPHRVKAIFKNDSYSYDVILEGRGGIPDCKISSFGANIWFRTRNGVNEKKYANIEAVEKAVKNVSKKYGLELDCLEVSEGIPATI